MIMICSARAAEATLIRIDVDRHLNGLANHGRSGLGLSGLRRGDDGRRLGGHLHVERGHQERWSTSLTSWPTTSSSSSRSA